MDKQIEIYDIKCRVHFSYLLAWWFSSLDGKLGIWMALNDTESD